MPNGWHSAQGGAFASSASVLASENDRTFDNNIAHLVINAYSADLVVSGTGPGDLVAGASANYTMNVVNSGPDPAPNVRIGNLVDPDQTLSSINCVAAGGAICPAVLGVTMMSTLIPVGGSLSFTVSAQPRPGTIGPITNKLQVIPVGDPNSIDNYATATAFVAVPSNPGSLVQLNSDAGDYIGGGGTYAYDRANSSLVVEASGSRLNVTVRGYEVWNASFQLPGALSELQPGVYTNLTRTGGATVGGLDWSGQGRGCNSLAGSIVVNDVAYVGSTLALIDLRFEQHCEGSGPALRGRVRWTASDTTPPPQPIAPPPTDLWRPAAGATPASGSFVYLQSETYDSAGGGQTYLYTMSDAAIAVEATDGRLGIGVRGDERWLSSFLTMSPLSQLQPGYYRGLSDGYNPARGGFSWNSDYGCSDSSLSWVVIDQVTYSAGTLSSLDLRFEQRCNGSIPALHGQIHWVAGETTQPPGPRVPPPASLWSPPADSTPDSGNYVYLQSDDGDYVGQGHNHLFTPANAAVTLIGSGRTAQVRIVQGDNAWDGSLEAMSSLTRLTPGLYENLLRWPFHNPAKGGMTWDGEGRGCNQSWGWLVVDNVTYAGDNLASLDLRFEQHCSGYEPALRGKLHWVN